MENSSAPRVLEIDGVVYRLIYSGENNLSLEPVESSASTSASAGSSGSIRGGPDSCKQQSKGSLKRVRREAAAVDEEDDDDDDDEEDEEDEVDDEDVESRVPHKKEPRKKRKRTSWNSEEIEKLIDILIEKHIVDKLDGKCGRLRHNEIFKSVVKALNAAKLGPQKDVSNCRIKYKKLKEGFFDCVKNNSTSGQNRVSIPYYDKLSVLFSKRPRNSICDWGYDSKFDAGNSENMDPASAATAQLPEGTEERGSESLEGVLTTSGRMMAVSNPATSESPAHKRFPPKYRSGAAKKNTSHMLLKEIMEKSETEAKEFKVWTDQRMAAAEERDEKMLKSFTAAISSSMENMAKILQPQPHQQQHTQYMPGMPFVSQQALWIALQSTLASNAASSLPPHIQVEGPTGAPSSSALPASFFAGQESKINSEARGASPASAAQISGAAAIRPGVVSTPATAAQISGAAAIRPGVASTPATAAQIRGAALIRPGVASRHPAPLQAIILKPRVAGKTNAVPVSLGVHLQGTFPQSTAQSGSTQAVRFVVSSSSTPPK